MTRPGKNEWGFPHSPYAYFNPHTEEAADPTFHPTSFFPCSLFRKWPGPAPYLYTHMANKQRPTNIRLWTWLGGVHDEGGMTTTARRHFRNKYKTQKKNLRTCGWFRWRRRGRSSTTSGFRIITRRGVSMNFECRNLSRPLGNFKVSHKNQKNWKEIITHFVHGSCLPCSSCSTPTEDIPWRWMWTIL